MRTRLKDLERRREQTIRRVADERGQIVMLAGNVVSPANGMFRFQRRLLLGLAFASAAMSTALPVAAFLFRLQPAVLHIGQAMLLWRVIKNIGRGRA